MPVRIQWSRFDGPMPNNTKLITRNGQFGNPWVVGKDGTREEVVARFEALLADRSQYPDVVYPSDEEIAALSTYDHVACACNFDGRCHGDPLIDRIELLQALGGDR